MKTIYKEVEILEDNQADVQIPEIFITAGIKPIYEIRDANDKLVLNIEDVSPEDYNDVIDGVGSVTICQDYVSFDPPLGKGLKVMFMGSYCEHCMDMDPELVKEIKESLKQVENNEVIEYDLDDNGLRMDGN